MSYLSTLGDTGSFRGAQFLIQESRSAFGRRQKLHEYPFREVPYAEDLGLAAQRWSIDCMVIGPDYNVARDALIKALQAKGPGTLVHPYLGSVQAIVETPAQVSESTAEGGVARFSIQFAQAGANTTPASSADTQGAAVAAAAAVQASATKVAIAGISVTGVPSWVQAAAGVLTGSGANAISTALAVVSGAGAPVFSLQQQLGALAALPLAALASPADLVSTIFSSVMGIADLSTYAEDALTQLIGPTGAVTGPTNGLIGWGSDLSPVSPTTPSLAIAATNQQTISQLIQAAAAAAAVSVVSDMAFTSYDDAVGIRDPLADQLDQLAVSIADTGADVLADSIDALRVAMVADLTTRGASLQRVYSYTPTVTEPALVIAQRLYGDATQVDDLIARNNLTAPLFCPGGQALEVLSAGE